MQIVTSDLEIRPLADSDRERLAEAFTALSEDTRRRRFGGLASRLGEGDLDRLTSVDHHDHEALAAVAGGRIVGVARYFRLPDNRASAEVAIAVDDAWQGRGVGRRLMRELVERARDEGVTRLLAYVGVDNHAVLAWAGRAGGSPVARDGDAIVFAIPLDGSGVEQRAA